MINTSTDIKDMANTMLEDKPTWLRHITAHEMEQLLKSPLETYLIDVQSQTIFSDIVFKLQRMGLGEFTSEQEIFNLIVQYESNYGLTLHKAIETFNEMVRRYYAGLLLQKEDSNKSIIELTN